MTRIAVAADLTTADEIAADLALVRRANGFTQEKLAELCGVPRYRIDNWESGLGLTHSLKLFAAFEACGGIVRVMPGPLLKTLLSRQS